MKILDVSPRVIQPLSSGSRVRIYNLLSRLARRHDIRQFSQTRRRDLRRPGFEEEALYAPRYLEHRRRDFAGSWLCEWMERTGFGAPVLCGLPLRIQQPRLLREWADWADILMVEFPWQYAHCRAIAAGKPVVLATHNVQASKARSANQLTLLERRVVAWTDRLEREAVQGADLIFAVSEDDRRDFSLRYGVNDHKITVVPNGADLQMYRPAIRMEKEEMRERLRLPAGPMVIFPAPHRQKPILEALKWVRRTAELAPEVHFLITGAVRSMPKTEGNLIFTGFVDAYQDYLRSADAMICPIALGGGTKLKLIEAAGAGLPIVAFQESVRGTRFRNGEELLVVEHDAQGLARSLRRVLEDCSEAERLGAAARKCAVEHYDWDEIADGMSGQLESLLPRRSMRGGVAAR